MYRYWYDYSKVRFGDKISLMYTDADSFIFVVKCEDYFKTINYTDYDISNFDESLANEIYSNWKANKKRVGIPKSETGNTIIESVAVLRSKMYSVKIDYHYLIDPSKDKLGIKETNTAKGIKRYLIKKITHDVYYNCLFDATYRCEMNMLRQSNHDIYNGEQRENYHNLIVMINAFILIIYIV